MAVRRTNHSATMTSLQIIIDVSICRDLLTDAEENYRKCWQKQ